MIKGFRSCFEHMVCASCCADVVKCYCSYLSLVFNCMQRICDTIGRGCGSIGSICGDCCDKSNILESAG